MTQAPGVVNLTSETVNLPLLFFQQNEKQACLQIMENRPVVILLCL